jgi:hypothetical protein
MVIIEGGNYIETAKAVIRHYIPKAIFVQRPRDKTDHPFHMIIPATREHLIYEITRLIYGTYFFNEEPDFYLCSFQERFYITRIIKNKNGN